MIRLLLPLTLLLATAAVAAPVCDGQMVTMRVSKINAGSDAAAGFAAAVKDHAAWYKAKGLASDHFVTTPAIVYYEGGMKPSADEMITLHVQGGSQAPDHKNNPAWDAFVAKYRASSKILSETRMCLPKTAALVVK